MIAEAIEKLNQLFDRGNKTSISRLPDPRPEKYLIQKPDGSVEEYTAEPPYRSIHCHSIASLVSTLATLEKRDEYVNNPAVYVSMNTVVLVLNTQTGYETATLDIDPSRELQWLAQLYDQRVLAYNARDAFQLFDTELAGLVDDKFRTKIGKLKIVSDGMAEAAHDAASSLTGGIAQRKLDEDAGLIHTDHPLNVRPFSNALPGINTRLPVRVRIRPNLDANEWDFHIIDQEYDQFVYAAQELLARTVIEQLEKYGVEANVYTGVFRHAKPEAPQQSPLDRAFQ